MLGSIAIRAFSIGIGICLGIVAVGLAPLWLFPLLQPLVRFLERRKKARHERSRLHD